MACSLLAVVRSIDAQLPLTHVESMDQMVSEGQASRRFNTAVISGFAGAAVLLALLGIYSVIAFSVALRTQEMAIRLALGAQRVSVMRLVLVSGARLGLMGCGIGIVAALFATRLLRSMLFQVDPLDPCVIVLADLNLSARTRSLGHSGAPRRVHRAHASAAHGITRAPRTTSSLESHKHHDRTEER